jgi:hypothetical protein
MHHTPGPWQVNSNDPLHVCDADGESRGCSPIAFVQVGNDGRWAAKANARLIAAAPELLERLEELLEYSENLRGSGVYSRARAAIRAATGA